jgi:hypothetical protein
MIKLPFEFLAIATEFGQPSIRVPRHVSMLPSAHAVTMFLELVAKCAWSGLDGPRREISRFATGVTGPQTMN